MKGAPRNASRAAALEAGRVRYHGKPCPNCSGTERYVCNHACVVCVHAWRPTGEAKPCRNGHIANRFASGHCSACCAENQRRYRKAKAAKKAAPSRLQAFRAEQTARQRRAMGLPA